MGTLSLWQVHMALQLADSTCDVFLYQPSWLPSKEHASHPVIANCTAIHTSNGKSF